MPVLAVVLMLHFAGRGVVDAQQSKLPDENVEAREEWFWSQRTFPFRWSCISVTMLGIRVCSIALCKVGSVTGELDMTILFGNVE